MSRRKPRFSKPVVWILGTLCLVAVGWLCIHASWSIDGAYIGCYSDGNGDRIALQRIASDIRRYPTEQTFQVRWSSSKLAWLHLDDEGERFKLVYDRKSHALSYIDNGGKVSWSDVSDQIISSVARSHGSIFDLEQYGCHAWP